MEINKLSNFVGFFIIFSLMPLGKITISFTKLGHALIGIGTLKTFNLFQPFILALSIKCWNCRSSTDPKCADPFDNSTVPITDCNQEKGLSHLPGMKPSMCRKIRQKGK